MTDDSDQPAVIDHLLDIAQDFKARHDNTPRWRIITRHGLLTAWLEVVWLIQRIEQRTAQRRINERRQARAPRT